MKKLNDNWDLKYYDLEERFFSLENVRKELEGECGNLRETVASLKIDHEERMR